MIQETPVFEDYCFPKERLSGSLSRIKNYMLDPNPSNVDYRDRIAHDLEIAIFAVRHFAALDEEMKGEIEIIRNFVQDYSDELPAFKQKIGESLLRNFLNKEELKEELHEQTIPAEDLRSQQTKAIYDLLINIFHDYLSPQIFGDAVPFSPAYERKRDAEWNTHIYKLVSAYCFQNPRTLNESDKKWIGTLFETVSQFLVDLGRCNDEVRKTKEEERETLIVTKLFETVQNKGWFAVDPHHSRSESLLFAEADLIEKLLAYFLSEQSISSLLLRDYLQSRLQILFDPYTICLILDRLLEDDFSVSCQTAKEQTTELKYDENFSRKIGLFLYQMIMNGLKLGNPTGVTASLIDIVRISLEVKQKNLGDQIQKAMGGLLSTECMILPFVLIEKLLYNSERIPIMSGKLLRTKEEKEEFKKQVEARLENRLHQLIIDQLKERRSSAESWIAKHLSSLRSFSNNISYTLFHLTQNEAFLKILSLYILRALYGNLKQTPQRA